MRVGDKMTKDMNKREIQVDVAKWTRGKFTFKGEKREERKVLSVWGGIGEEEVNF